MLKIRSNILFIFGFLTALLLFGCSSQSPKAPLLPITDFFKNPEKDKFKISPAGDKLAFLMPYENRMNIFVRDINNNNSNRITNSTNRDIKYFFWASDDRIVYLQDNNGDENFQLYAVDPDGSHHNELTPFKNTSVHVIDELPENNDEMIISLNKRDKTAADAYRINIKTGELILEAKNPGKVTKWITDNSGRIRIAMETDGVNVGLLYRDDKSNNFTPSVITDFKNELTPLFFTPDNKYVYVCTNINRDKCAIVKYDLENNRELEEIYSRPDVDVWKLLNSKKKNKLIGVAFTDWKKRIYFFDQERKQLQNELEQLLPDLEVMIVNSNKDEDRFIVKTFSDKSLGSYYYYNFKEKDLVKLADVSPWLNPENMASMKPISYKSRDGLTIHGYLTFPKGVEHKNLPVVVLPHGGPWIRDNWGFDKEVQFLANRGYVVLQMNYRGSSGYGKKFWQAGFKEWGKKMQEDIEDGVEWLIRQEIADQERIAIFGYSFGGYAALNGVVKTPELYKCAVSISGINNLFAFLKSIPPYWKPFQKMLYEMVGNPDEDYNDLKKSSPVFHTDKIISSIFIAQGGNDPRVPYKYTSKFVKKLKKNKVHVKYFFKEKEGHSFRNEENKIELYKEIEIFLAENLRGRKSELKLKSLNE